MSATRNLFLTSLLVAICGSPDAALAAKFNRVIDIGQAAPSWSDLIGTDDKRHSLDEHRTAKAVVVVFTCNHCPVAKAYEDRLLTLHAKYRDKGVALVAISVSQLETDGLPEMKKRATAKKYGFSYLHDATQKIGHAYGAASTPQVFLLDEARKVAYMGKIDDSLHAEKVNEQFLADAIDAVLAGKRPEVTETKPTGCPIDYERR